MQPDILHLRLELERLRNWPIGMGSSPAELGEKTMAIAELNLKIAELLLRTTNAA